MLVTPSLSPHTGGLITHSLTIPLCHFCQSTSAETLQKRRLMEGSPHSVLAQASDCKSRNYECKVVRNFCESNKEPSLLHLLLHFHRPRLNLPMHLNSWMSCTMHADWDWKTEILKTHQQHTKSQYEEIRYFKSRIIIFVQLCWKMQDITHQ